jgi:chromate transport protein ChrA
LIFLKKTVIIIIEIRLERIFKEKQMKSAFLVSAIAVAGFVFLAWQFNHWWIALFALLFMYSFEKNEKEK